MPTPQKEAILQDTRERITDVRGLYLADFTGMTVQSLSLLRKRCREQGVQLANVAGAARGRRIIRRHDRAQSKIGHDVDHLAAVAP